MLIHLECSTTNQNNTPSGAIAQEQETVMLDGDLIISL